MIHFTLSSAERQEFSPSLSNLIDFVSAQEDYHRAEMLRLKRIRGRLEARIQTTLDEFSTIAEIQYTQADKGEQ